MSALKEQLDALRVPAKTLARRRHFPVETTVLRVEAAKKRLKIAARHLVAKENAQALVARVWPKEKGESAWAIVPGDFVFGDVIPAVIEQAGAPRSLWICTLSLGTANVEALREVLRICPVTLMVSTYFRNTDGEIFAALEKLKLECAGFTLVAARIHTKLLLFDYEALPVVMEGSANLRSNNSYEQVAVHADAALFFFYLNWMKSVLKQAEGGSTLAKLL